MGVLSASGPIRKVGEGGGGEAACRTMIYIFVYARVRDSARGVERGGGNWSQRAAFHMRGGGGGGGRSSQAYAGSGAGSSGQSTHCLNT